MQLLHGSLQFVHLQTTDNCELEGCTASAWLLKHTRRAPAQELCFAALSTWNAYARHFVCPFTSIITPLHTALTPEQTDLHSLKRIPGPLASAWAWPRGSQVGAEWAQGIFTWACSWKGHLELLVSLNWRPRLFQSSPPYNSLPGTTVTVSPSSWRVGTAQLPLSPRSLHFTFEFLIPTSLYSAPFVNRLSVLYIKCHLLPVLIGLTKKFVWVFVSSYVMWTNFLANLILGLRDFPDGPVGKTLYFQFMRCRFNPCSGN